MLHGTPLVEALGTSFGSLINRASVLSVARNTPGLPEAPPASMLAAITRAQALASELRDAGFEGPLQALMMQESAGMPAGTLAILLYHTGQEP